MRTEAQKRAKRKYEKKVKQIIIRIYPTEKDILEKVYEEALNEGYSPYIKRLIREDIAKEE